MNIKAGTAYVDIKLGSVENLKRQLKQKMEEHGRESGQASAESFSKHFGDTVRKNVSSSGFGSNFKSVGKAFSTYAIPAIAASIIAYAPFLGSLLGASIIGASALAAIGAGFLLIKDNPAVKKGLEDVKTLAGNTFRAAAQPLVPAFLDSLEIVKAGIASIGPSMVQTFAAVAPFVTTLTRGLVGFVQAVAPAFANLMTKAKPVIDAISFGIEELGKGIAKLLNEVVSSPEAIEGMAHAMRDLFRVVSTVIGWIGTLIKVLSEAYAYWRTGVTVWKNFISNLGSIASSGFARVVSFVQNLWSTIKSLFSTGVSSIKSAFSSGVSSVVSLAQGLPGRIVSALGGLGSRLYSAGADAMRGFLNGLADVGSAVITKARSIADSVVSTISDALSIGSPSKVMYQIGRWTMEGFVNGLDAMTPAVANSLALPSPVRMDFGSLSSPQMDKSGSGLGSALVINGDLNMSDETDPWRVAEDLYFINHARGY